MIRAMAQTSRDLLWKLAESDEVQIEARRDAKSPQHSTTIWIVTTDDGVYVRSFKAKKGRWYQEATANPEVTIKVGNRRVKARAEAEHKSNVNRAVSAAYQEKYGERWPNETKPMVQPSVVATTLRLTPE
jgi:hypothetical protein